jgi:hypothetical protein
MVCGSIKKEMEVIQRFTDRHQFFIVECIKRIIIVFDYPDKGKNGFYGDKGRLYADLYKPVLSVLINLADKINEPIA